MTFAGQSQRIATAPGYLRDDTVLLKFSAKETSAHCSPRDPPIHQNQNGAAAAAGHTVQCCPSHACHSHSSEAGIVALAKAPVARCLSALIKDLPDEQYLAIMIAVARPAGPDPTTAVRSGLGSGGPDATRSKLLSSLSCSNTFIWSSAS